jgi:hypothetical protein
VVDVLSAMIKVIIEDRGRAACTLVSRRWGSGLVVSLDDQGRCTRGKSERMKQRMWCKEWSGSSIELMVVVETDSWI